MTTDRKLGTFLGVYTPTILTILGVIMYLRVGWLVGHMGLGRVILAVLIANVITAITALSFSAVATNTRVGGGGAYFIISRSLGIEVGGAIGVPLFLSQAVSVTLYAFGLAESLRIIWPELPLQMVTVAIVLAVALISVPGAKLALRAQIPLMGLVGASLAVLVIGILTRHQGSEVSVSIPSGQITFWHGFAVFFPAVTGVMAGLGLSGDLKNPGRAIPLGSLLAVLTGFAVYLAVPMLLASGVSTQALRDDPLIWTKVAVLGPWLVLPGLWAAIFSSAVGSVLGAPRTLQALSRDGLAPRFLGRITGDWREILPGLGVTLAISLAAVFLGDLNSVALLVTIFFLTVYGTANFVAASESLSAEPSWRPKIRIPWPVSIVGGVACAAVIFLIHPLAGTIALVAELLLWLILSRQERTATWGDVRRGIYEQLIRWALVHLAQRTMTARNWRPHILVFSKGPTQDLNLVRFANWFCHGRGVVTVSQLVVGDALTSDPNVPGRIQEMQEIYDANKLVVFPEVDAVQDLINGITDVAQANGMAGIESNTVLLGWPEDRETQVEFLHVMRRLEILQRSLILGRVHKDYRLPPEYVGREIDVWWGGLQQNGDLMLLLAYLLARNSSWRGAKVRVQSMATTEMMKVQTENYLRTLIPRIRIQAEPRVTVRPKDMTIAELIHQESADAEAVFLGLATPEEGGEEAYAERIEKLAGELPAVFFVKNASVFIGELVGKPEPESDSGTGLPPG